MNQELDWPKLEEVALALLALTKHERGGATAAWKGLDWELTDRLHQRGWIFDPQGKSKSVVFTEQGAQLADEFLQKHFGTGREG